MRPLIKLEKTNYFTILYLAIFVMYGYVGYLSPGYDDEFFNIKLVELHGIEAVTLVQGMDVHPPGSYFVNWLLWTIFEDWSYVRLLIALFAASVIVFVISNIKKNYGVAPALIVFGLIGLNPALLLWTTGVRWYAFFVPILLWLSVVPKNNDWWYWAKCFLGLLLLGYFGYLVFMVAIPLIYLYWRGDNNSIQKKIKSVTLYGIIFIFLYMHQLLIFLDVHLPNKGSQVSSLEKSIIGFAVAQLSNQGVFPVSLAGGISAFGMVCAMLLIFIYSLRENLRKNDYFLSYWIAVIFFIASGIAGKFRNFVALSPWQGIYMSVAEIPENKKTYYYFFIMAVIIGNCFGIANVITHSETTKNSWNLPVPEVKNFIGELRLSCKDQLLIMTHDPTLAFVLEKDGYFTLSPYTINTISSTSFASLKKLPDCLVALKTYAGSISDDQINKMYGSLGNIKAASIENEYFGLDRHYELKRKLDGRYPKFQVELIVYRNPVSLDNLESWVSEQE